MIQRPSPLQQGSGPLDRRSLLRGSGLAAVALGGSGILAACSGAGASDPADPAPSSAPEASGSGGDGPSAPTPDSESPETDSPEAEAPDEAPEAEAPDGFEVDPAAVPVGGGLILVDSDFVVTQPEEGDFRAFSKICTHQGCPVSEVADSEIVCFCHGSAFSIQDGSVIQGPAEQALAEATVTDQDGRLYVS